MTSSRPGSFAAASQRLLRKPGRPLKRTPEQSDSAAHEGEVDTGPREGATPSQAAITPRLLSLKAAAAYLGVSDWTLRELVDAGVLPRVRIPLPGGRDLRKLLIDKVDLDRLIECWKE